MCVRKRASVQNSTLSTHQCTIAKKGERREEGEREREEGEKRVRRERREREERGEREEREKREGERGERLWISESVIGIRIKKCGEAFKKAADK